MEMPPESKGRGLLPTSTIVARVFGWIALVYQSPTSATILRTVADRQISVHTQFAHLLFADDAGDDILPAVGQLARLPDAVAALQILGACCRDSRP